MKKCEGGQKEGHAHVEIWGRQRFNINKNTNEQKESLKNRWPNVPLAQENLFIPTVPV